MSAERIRLQSLRDAAHHSAAALVTYREMRSTLDETTRKLEDAALMDCIARIAKSLHDLSDFILETGGYER